MVKSFGVNTHRLQTTLYISSFCHLRVQDTETNQRVFFVFAISIGIGRLHQLCTPCLIGSSHLYDDRERSRGERAIEGFTIGSGSLFFYAFYWFSLFLLSSFRFYSRSSRFSRPRTLAFRVDFRIRSFVGVVFVVVRFIALFSILRSNCGMRGRRQ